MRCFISVAGAVAVAAASLGAARAEDCTLKRVAQMPIVAGYDGSPVVSVLIDDQPRKMLLDTGGFWSMIDRSAVANISQFMSPVDTRLGLAGLPLTKAIKVPSVQIGVLKAEHVDFLVPPAGYMGDIDGTLGANWLKLFDVEIDPGNNTASLFSQKHCEGQVIYWPHRDLAEVPVYFDSVQGHLRIPITLQGQEIEALIDTGASQTTLSLLAARLRFGITPDSPGVEKLGTVKSENGVEKPTYRYQFESMSMNGITFKHPWITLAPMAEIGTEMIIGMHHLGALHLYFAYGERKLYATSVRGDMAEREAQGAAGDAPQPAATDPLARANAEDFVKTAEIALRNNDAARAAAAIDKAMLMLPGFAPAYVARARLHAAMGEGGPAFQDLAEALRLDPEDAEAYEVRARFYHESGDGQRAMADIDRAAQLEPKSSTILNDRCWISTDMGSFDSALADCNAALALEPKSPEILDSRGRVHMKMGRLAEAIDDYDDALHRNPKSASSLYGRGLAKRDKGDAAGANADIAAAQAIDADIAQHFGK